MHSVEARDGTPRLLLRVGAVLVLLLAAIALSVGAHKYAYLSHPALRFFTIELVPLLIVGTLNLSAAAFTGNRARALTMVALLATALWLGTMTPHLRGDGPTIVYAEALVAFVLVLAAMARLWR